MFCFNVIALHDESCKRHQILPRGGGHGIPHRSTKADIFLRRNGYGKAQHVSASIHISNLKPFVLAFLSRTHGPLRRRHLRSTLVRAIGDFADLGNMFAIQTANSAYLAGISISSPASRY
jgi:hypothetical protein